MAVRDYTNLIVSEGQAQGVAPSLIAGVMEIESGGNPSAQSVAGALGLMQVMPFHAGAGENLLDPATNVRVGTRILRSGYDRWGAWDKALAAYFGAIDANGNITGATDATGTSGYSYVQSALAAQQRYLDMDGNGGGQPPTDPFQVAAGLGLVALVLAILILTD